ncbi:MAG: creatininase family protein [Spirochaetales bacterium]|nr:creatininase family protein [Candidatus Physcosoma equi]
MDEVHYLYLRPQQFLDRINRVPVGYLPLGTLEWHGFHMPLGADAIQSHGIMEILAKEFGGVVFPPLFLGPDIEDGKGHYGMDICSFLEGKAEQLEGSCYQVSDELFGSIICRIAENARRAGIRILVAHGHGPSMNYVRTHQKDFAIPIYTFFDIGLPEGPEGLMADHAAANETSLTMALYPGLVDLKEIEGFGYPLASWGKDPRTEASPEFGASLIRKNVDKAKESLVAILSTLDKRGPLKMEHTREHVKDLLS